MDGKSSKWTVVRQLLGKVLHQQTDEYKPEVFVRMLRTPSIRVFTLLKRRLKKSDTVWTEGFLNSGGLETLLEAIDVISSRRVTKFSEALRLLECVLCIERLVNSKLGLSFLIQHDSHIKKLVKGWVSIFFKIDNILWYIYHLNSLVQFFADFHCFLIVRYSLFSWVIPVK